MQAAWPEEEPRNQAQRGDDAAQLQVAGAPASTEPAHRRWVSSSGHRESHTAKIRAPARALVHELTRCAAYTGGMLERIRGPADLQHLSQPQLRDLAHEIRQFLVHKVAATGGHLGPNLGVVELTLALHRVFDSPHDPIIFDTGHQAYVHKMLTGRSPDFETLRKKGGLSGYPSRGESEHDWVESSHASAALSYADGLAKAFELTGHRNRHVVAVVGCGD
jgi:hypothetical protein